MSHAPERTEKNCLNCGTTVIGRFCHICGQENIVPKESFGKLVLHFFYDITHFDSKFFDTLKFLLLRPGFLSKEYIKGRRATYLNPIRMYVFTSAIFFLIFFSLKNQELKSDLTMDKTKKERIDQANELKKELAKDPGDSTLQNQINQLLDTSKNLPFKVGFVNARTYNSMREYDSVQAALPDDKKDGWFIRLMSKKSISLNESGRSVKNLQADFLNEFVHTLPYLLFISLPFFAAILKLLYVRRKFYYSEHIILTIHHYIFSFILLLLLFGVNALNSWLEWEAITWLGIGIFICWPLYLFLEMKNFYGQGFFKTFVKFLILNTLASIVLMILFVAFIFLSIYNL